MNARRQNNQLHLAFPADPRSEAERTAGEGTEAFAAERHSESPADSQRLMEAICEPDNLRGR